MRTSGGADSDDALVAAARALLGDVLPLLGPEAARQVEQIRGGLGEPLRLALAGRVSAGKSTLANALLGRRVAPTAAGECTQVVTWYRFGAPDRAEVVLRDGSRQPLPLADGLPRSLGVELSRVDHIEVTLQAAALRHYTLIDTPGLGSLHRPGDEAIRGAVLPRPGTSAPGIDEPGPGADAVLYLFRDTDRRDDLGFVQDCRRAVGAEQTSAVTVVGVLTHADVSGGGPWADEDPFTGATALADRIHADHVEQLAAVVPVAGLLAEAARTGRVTESDARALAALSTVDRVQLQRYPRRSLPAGVDPAAVDRVLERAGPYALNRGREVAANGAVALAAWLDDRSGLGALEAVVFDRFLRRSRPLKVAQALRQVERVARVGAVDAAAGAHVRDLIERLRLDPLTHRVNELDALHSLARSGAEGAPLRAELARLIDHDEPWQQLGAKGPGPAAELRMLARQLAGRSHARTTLAHDPLVQDAARVLSRSYQLLAGAL